MKRVGMVYKNFLIDITENLCDFHRGNRKSIILDLLKKKIGEKTNIFQPCPLKAQLLYLTNFTLTSIHMPAIPVGEYRLDLFFTSKTEKDVIVNTQVFATVKAIGAMDL